LSDLQWVRIKDFLPGRTEHVDRTAVDNRLFVNGVLWVLRSGARWHDPPGQADAAPRAAVDARDSLQFILKSS